LLLYESGDFIVYCHNKL